ncbi:MAG TPA: sigma-70 family RNA polymerase sigma factor [Polyangiaceae bacterium]
MNARPQLLRLADGDAASAGVCYPGAVGKETASLPPAALDHVDALFRVARSLTGRDEEAEDLVQETYTRALAGWGSFVPGSNLKAWLFRILRNAHIDIYRRARANPVHLGLDEERAPAGEANEPLRGDAELEQLRRVVTSDIEDALATLSDDARTILLLDLEGFTEAELSTALGCPAGTVKSRLCRARAALRERLRDYGSDR